MKKALVVGINDYPGHPLAGCVNDASAVAAVLRSEAYGFQVTELLNGAATRAGLRKAVTELFTDVDEAVFYFAGHGERTDTATVLSTVDRVEYEEGVDVEFIRKTIDARGSKAKLVMLVLDCCHSGGATARIQSVQRITTRDLADALPMKAEGRVVMAACGAEQLAYETDDGVHGSFTSHLVAGLKGAAADRNGTITVHTLFEFLSTHFELNAQQQPVFRGDTHGRVVLASGFVAASSNSVPTGQIQEVEAIVAEAKQHIAEYHQKSTGSISDWQERGYRESCDQLAPILSWFDRRSAQVPAALAHKDFLQQREIAYSRLHQLASMETGTETRWGRIEEYLGGGTFGSVYRLKQANGGQSVIKVYHPHDLRHQEKRSRFRRGYDAMRQLDHPHIVRVGEFVECPVAFLMDYVEGSNLRAFQGCTKEPDDLLRILLLVAETLRHAHARKVVHRDVKPENIIIKWEEDGGWTPYLTDFDLAWFSTATQVTKEALGSMYYAAPEQLSKPTSAVAHQPTTDIFAFGQLMYFVMMGSDPVPFGHANNNLAFEQRMDANAGYTERAARVLADLYARCTEDDPEDRIPTFGRICDQLFKTQRFMSGKDINGRLPTTQFLTELRFAIVGLTPSGVTHESFATVSRRVRLSIDPKELSDGKLRLQVHFQYEQHAAMPGIANDTMRATLNARIEAALKEFDEAKRKSGRQSVFETYVEIADVVPSLAFVARCRKIISRVIDVMEQA